MLSRLDSIIEEGGALPCLFGALGEPYTREVVIPAIVALSLGWHPDSNEEAKKALYAILEAAPDAELIKVHDYLSAQDALWVLVSQSLYPIPPTLFALPMATQKGGKIVGRGCVPAPAIHSFPMKDP